MRANKILREEMALQEIGKSCILQVGSQKINFGGFNDAVIWLSTFFSQNNLGTTSVEIRPSTSAGNLQPSTASSDRLRQFQFRHSKNPNQI